MADLSVPQQKPKSPAREIRIPIAAKPLRPQSASDQESALASCLPAFCLRHHSWSILPSRHKIISAQARGRIPVSSGAEETHVLRIRTPTVRIQPTGELKVLEVTSHSQQEWRNSIRRTHAP